MTLIRLRELCHDKDGAFQVRVSFDNEAEYQVAITGPADDAVEENLAWYFEKHLRYPFLDKERELRAVRQIAEYGEALFRQVFGRDANHDYRSLRDRSFDGCQIEISGSAAFHQLHWETLRDPELITPLSVRMPVTRRASNQPSRFEVRSDLPTLNIVVVTARPDGPRDVGYRTISRPLLDAVRTAGLPVTMDLVRPGTWQALCDHLRSVTERRGSGWYHVIHFDMHGAFSEYESLTAGRESRRLLLSPGLFAKFQGQRGFLFFETDKDKQAEPIPAEAVAGLLQEHRVPVAVLNACQSAMQSDNEAGLAQQLAEAGVPMTLGMAYSVTVSAARRAMPVLYRRIADGDDLTVALTGARRHLFEHRGRRGYFGQELDLEDWMLPVSFGQRSLQISLRDMTSDEYLQFHERQAEVAHEPPTEYGFVGRDLDIQVIEHRLLTHPDANELLVQGMAGAGKSTLLAHLAWWWQRTGLVDQVFRFSYEDRAWTSNQIVRDIRSKLMSPADHARADGLSEAAQAEQVAGLLRSDRHLLILDNAESITVAPAAIPHSLDVAERNKLRAFLARLRGGRTLVLVGSREAEKWLTAAQGPGVYSLPGLDEQAASLLIDRILDKHNARRWMNDAVERQALQDLVELLGGYPLPLTVVLPVLASVPPSEVLEDLRAGDSGPDPAGLMTKVIEYSYGKLDLALQKSLALLAPFTATVPTGSLLTLYEHLVGETTSIRKPGTVIDLSAALTCAMTAGLATDTKFGGSVRIHPVLPWFLRSQLASSQDLYATTQACHFLLYSRTAEVLVNILKSEREPRQLAHAHDMIRLEYANLTSAMEYGLAGGLAVSSIVGALDEYLDQTSQRSARRALLENIIAAYGQPEDEDRARLVELAYLHNLAGCLAIEEHRVDEAQIHHETELSLYGTANVSDNLGDTYHQLGRVAQARHQWEDAAQNYRESIEVKLSIGQRYKLAETYAQLGVVALAQHQYDEAASSYKGALDIYMEFGDRRATARIYSQLAALNGERGDFDEAADSSKIALGIFKEFEDPYGMAVTYNQLGGFAVLSHRLDESEQYLRSALDLWLDIGDLRRLAMTYLNMGLLAVEHGQRFTEAHSYYEQAIEYSLEVGAVFEAAKAYMALGEVEEKRRRLAEAEVAYRHALQILLQYQGESSSAARSLSTLLMELERQREAVAILLDATTVERHKSGEWSKENLRLLREEGTQLEHAEFTGLVEAHVPADLIEEFKAALDDSGTGEDFNCSQSEQA